jgi:hypothetical protein
MTLVQAFNRPIRVVTTARRFNREHRFDSSHFTVQSRRRRYIILFNNCRGVGVTQSGKPYYLIHIPILRLMCRGLCRCWAGNNSRAILEPNFFSHTIIGDGVVLPLPFAFAPTKPDNRVSCNALYYGIACAPKGNPVFGMNAV